MNIAASKSRKMLSWIIDLPVEIIERRNLRRKVQSCCLGEGVVLHPASRIENNRKRPDAIVIAAKTYMVGYLQVLAHAGNINIGGSCFVGEYSRIWSANSISIGDRVLISHNVNIHDHDSHSLSACARHHHFAEIMASGSHPAVLDDVNSAPIVIQDDVWVGFNAVILKGVTIGRGAVVGAASVVTKDVPAYAIVVGNPARIVGQARP